MRGRSLLRASDADREHVAGLLHQASVEGRLEPEEFDERLGRAFGALTYGELDALVADLPVAVAIQSRRSHEPSLIARALTLLTVAVMLAALAVRYAPRFSFRSVGPGVSGHGHPGGVYLFHHVFTLFAPVIGLCGMVALCAGLAWLFADRDPAS